MHSAEHIATFEARTDALRAALGRLLDGAHALAPVTDEVRAALAQCNRSVMQLRRNEGTPEDMGPLNSVSALQGRHANVAAAVEAFAQHLVQLFDVERDLRLLHPSVVASLRARQTSEAPPDPARDPT